jgi:hypothetical protein
VEWITWRKVLGRSCPYIKCQLAITSPGRSQIVLFFFSDFLIDHEIRKMICFLSRGRMETEVELNVPWTKVPSQEKGKDNSQTRVRYLKKRDDGVQTIQDQKSAEKGNTQSSKETIR